MFRKRFLLFIPMIMLFALIFTACSNSVKAPPAPKDVFIQGIRTDNGLSWWIEKSPLTGRCYEIRNSDGYHSYTTSMSEVPCSLMEDHR